MPKFWQPPSCSILDTHGALFPGLKKQKVLQTIVAGQTPLENTKIEKPKFLIKLDN